MPHRTSTHAMIQILEDTSFQDDAALITIANALGCQEVHYTLLSCDTNEEEPPRFLQFTFAEGAEVEFAAYLDEVGIACAAKFG